MLKYFKTLVHSLLLVHFSRLSFWFFFFDFFQLFKNVNTNHDSNVVQGNFPLSFPIQSRITFSLIELPSTCQGLQTSKKVWWRIKGKIGLVWKMQWVILETSSPVYNWYFLREIDALCDRLMAFSTLHIPLPFKFIFLLSGGCSEIFLIYIQRWWEEATPTTPLYKKTTVL